MKNKTLVVVLGLAVVSAIITLLVGSSSRMHPMWDQDSLVDRQELSSDYISSPPMGMSSVSTKIGMMPPYYGGGDALEVTDRSYEQYASYSVVIEDVSGYFAGIKEYAASIDAVVLSSNISSGGKYKSGNLYIKVPMSRFAEATQRVTQGVETVIDENISTNDVTGTVQSTQERVEQLKLMKQLAEARLAEASTAAEKIAIQAEVDSLTREISNAEKSEVAVNERVSYGTLSISAASNERYYNYDSGSGAFGGEFSRAWESLKIFARLLAVTGIWVLVYAIVWIPAVLIFKAVKSWLTPVK